jgi:uncharacterized protein YjbI with pentapeptide repeats
VDLSGSSLKAVSMDIVYLTNANLSSSDLSGAKFCQVELTGADLRHANLNDISYDQFTLYSLAKANLDGATMSDKLKSDLQALADGTSERS